MGGDAAAVGYFTNGTNSTAHHGADHGAPLPILFVFFSLLIGMLCQRVVSRLPIPYTALLLIMGLAIGMLTRLAQVLLDAAMMFTCVLVASASRGNERGVCACGGGALSSGGAAPTSGGGRGSAQRCERAAPTEQRGPL